MLRLSWFCEFDQKGWRLDDSLPVWRMTFLLELAGIREPWSGCVSALVFFFFLYIFWLAGRDVTQRACLSTPRLLDRRSVPVRLRCTPSGSKRQSLMLPSRVLNELSLFMNIHPLSPVSTARPALNESMRFCVFTWARGHTRCPRHR